MFRLAWCVKMNIYKIGLFKAIYRQNSNFIYIKINPILVQHYQLVQKAPFVEAPAISGGKATQLRLASNAAH